MPYVERVDSDSSSAVWIVVGVIALLIVLLLLAWSGLFGPAVQQYMPFTPAPTIVQPQPGTGGSGGTGGTGGSGGTGGGSAPVSPGTTSPSAPTT